MLRYKKEWKELRGGRDVEEKEQFQESEAGLVWRAAYCCCVSRLALRDPFAWWRRGGGR